MSLLEKFDFRQSLISVEEDCFQSCNQSFNTASGSGSTSEDIQQVAKRLSRQHGDFLGFNSELSHEFEDNAKSVEKDNGLNIRENFKLDPSSPEFDARTWVHALHCLSQQDTRNPGRSAGFSFLNLTVTGSLGSSQSQGTVGNFGSRVYRWLQAKIRSHKQERRPIISSFEGLVRPGELLVVLGPPGSGCSTFLKTIAGESHGLHTASSAQINYQGISAREMSTRYKGEAIYTAEMDVHFPEMTVGDTLYFSACARMSRSIPEGFTRSTWALLLRDTVMATFGISHTAHTRVGNDFIRGVSGGERKRVTIAEAASSGAAIQCWDNSTRGLDSSNAV